MLLKFKEGNRVKIHNDWLGNESEIFGNESQIIEYNEFIKNNENHVFKILNSDDLPEIMVRVESEDSPGVFFTLPEFGLELI